MAETLYFSAYTTAWGNELWKVDAAGNVSPVMDIAPGAASSNPGNFISHNGEVYFSAKEAGTYELWKIALDGTVSKIATSDGSPITDFGGAAVANGKLYFTAVGVSGQEPYVIGPDGLILLVGDIHPSGGSGGSSFTAVGETVYFRAYSPATSTELWKIAPNGTVSLVPEVSPGTLASDPSDLTAFRGTLYFTAKKASTGYELYKLRPDGTPELVKDIGPHTESSNPAELTVFNGEMFFRTRTMSFGDEIWKVKADGDAVRVTAFNPGVTDSDPANFTQFNGSLYFTASAKGGDERELWRIGADGSVAKVTSINTMHAASPADLTVFNGALYFTAYSETYGTELWKLSASGVATLVSDIEPGSEGSDILELVVMGNALYFSAWTSANGQELWRLGADGALRRLTDLVPGPAGSVYDVEKGAIHTTPEIAPVITSNGGTSSASISVTENQPVVTTVVATDDLPGVTFSLSGVDADRFNIAPGGALTFKSAPDFEKPTDQGGNNVYDVVVTATDIFGLTDSQALSITVTDVKGITWKGSSGKNNKTGTLEADTLKGKGGNDKLKGGGGKDTIDGGAGNDKLWGGEANDKLTGGSGRDSFVFNVDLASAGIDKITDFSHADDTILLEDSVFAALGASVTSNEFVARAHGHAATKASHKLIYDKSKGSLWYDADGKGSEAAVQIAQLGTTKHHPTDLSYTDFAIV